ncbi:MAG: ATP-binding protein [Bacteroidota bacterium]
METLFKLSENRIKQVPVAFTRSLFDIINWNCRLIEIRGSRGTGKTTLMLQRAKNIPRDQPEEVLYSSLDDPYYYSRSIIETAEEFVKYGGKYLFLDEVHKYPPKHKESDWSAEVKVIYDRYPELNIIYSGSSLLALHKGLGDLSRRKCSYNLSGLSFREYLNWNYSLNIPVYGLYDILRDHIKISTSVTEKIKVLPAFQEYLKTGFFPFYAEAPKEYCRRLKDILNVILEQDVNIFTAYNAEIFVKLKKLLAVLSDSSPFTPNFSQLRSDLYISDHRTLLNYLSILEKAELLNLLQRKAKGIKKLQKPDKVYLKNTNLAYCLHDEKLEKGMLRECFFMNQLRVKHEVFLPSSGDFFIFPDLCFEVGGKNKTAKQLTNNKGQSFLAIDDIETGFGNRIPLWMFGLLY